MIGDGFMGIYGQLNDGYTYNTHKKRKILHDTKAVADRWLL